MEEHVRAETVRAVFQQALLAPLLTLFVTLLIGAALWRTVSHAPLLVWLGTIMAISLGRLLLVLVYRRRAPAPFEMIAWERAFVFTLIAVSLAWGLGGALLLPTQSLAHEAIIYFFLIGIAGGAVASYSAHPVACLVCVVSLMVPVLVRFALQDVIELRALGGAGFLFLVASIRASGNYGRFWRRTFQLSWELQQAHVLADRMARTDDLTGLNNRRAFTELSGRAVEQARRYQRPLALVMFDIDHFKQINDTHGHAAGDRVLQVLAETIRHTVRDGDIAGRLGGEEFAVLVPETGGVEAVQLAERLRAAVAALAVSHEGKPIAFTCSFGVAARTDDITALDALLSRADEALYRAKRQGRDRISRDGSAREG